MKPLNDSNKKGRKTGGEKQRTDKKQMAKLYI